MDPDVAGARAPDPDTGELDGLADARDLARAREAARADLMRARH